MRATPLVMVMLASVACGQRTSGDGNDGEGEGRADSSSVPTSQSKAFRAREAGHVLWLLERSGAAAIVCDGPEGEIRIAPGDNPEDETGLVVTGAYSYGTDEIREIFARGNLYLNWGEEGNYVLTIANYAWHLFGYDGSETPSIEGDLTTTGAIVSESETAAQVTCRPVR